MAWDGNGAIEEVIEMEATLANSIKDHDVERVQEFLSAWSTAVKTTVELRHGIDRTECYDVLNGLFRFGTPHPLDSTKDKCAFDMFATMMTKNRLGRQVRAFEAGLALEDDGRLETATRLCRRLVKITADAVGNRITDEDTERMTFDEDDDLETCMRILVNAIENGTVEVRAANSEDDQLRNCRRCGRDFTDDDAGCCEADPR